MEDTTPMPPRRRIFAPDEEVLDIDPATWSPKPFVPKPLEVRASGQRVPEAITTKNAPQANLDKKPIKGLAAEQVDRELDLKHELLTLNQARDRDRQAMEELLYHLHKLMAETGRAGKFTPFLRNDLGWDEKYAYTKAMRWIAAYELRAGLIDEEAYKKRMGNGSITLRSDSSADRPTAPPLEQSFTTAEGDAEIVTPAFTSEEIAENASQIEARRLQMVGTVLHRAVLPQGQRDWYDFAWQQQARRHQVKTYKDTLLAVFLNGTRKAAADDEWGCFLDGMLNDTGRVPELALQLIPPRRMTGGSRKMAPNAGSPSRRRTRVTTPLPKTTPRLQRASFLKYLWTTLKMSSINPR